MSEDGHVTEIPSGPVASQTQGHLDGQIKAPAAPRTGASAVTALVLALLSWFLLPVVGSVLALLLAGTRSDRLTLNRPPSPARAW